MHPRAVCELQFPFQAQFDAMAWADTHPSTDTWLAGFLNFDCRPYPVAYKQLPAYFIGELWQENGSS